jgi:hypothetical protein
LGNFQVWFRENWYEEVLRLLRQGLAKCYAIAFENRGAVCDAVITPHTLNFVKKLVSTFGLGIGKIFQIVFWVGKEDLESSTFHEPFRKILEFGHRDINLFVGRFRIVGSSRSSHRPGPSVPKDEGTIRQRF